MDVLTNLENIQEKKAAASLGFPESLVQLASSKVRLILLVLFKKLHCKHVLTAFLLIQIPAEVFRVFQSFVAFLRS